MWGVEQHQVIQDLKIALVNTPVFIPFDYNAVNDRPIIIGVDTSLQGWGGYLDQVSKDRKHRHIAKYENNT